MKVGDLVMTLPRSGKQTPLTREKKLQNFEVGIVLLANYDYGTKGGKFARVFWFGAQNNQDLETILTHFENKILKLKERLHFSYSKRVAEKLERRIKIQLDLPPS